MDNNLSLYIINVPPSHSHLMIALAAATAEMTVKTKMTASAFCSYGFSLKK
jgi:hypothetical protein